MIAIDIFKSLLQYCCLCYKGFNLSSTSFTFLINFNHFKENVITKKLVCLMQCITMKHSLLH